MFWTVAITVLVVVLAAAWLFDRRAKARHQLRNIDETESMRHGPEGMNQAYGFGVNAGSQGGRIDQGGTGI